MPGELLCPPYASVGNKSSDDDDDDDAMSSQPVGLMDLEVP